MGAKASLHHLSLILLLAFVFVLNINDPASASLTNRVAIDLCNKSSDQNFCIGALASDPRSESADFYGLAIISFDLLRANLTHALAFSSQMSNEIQDPSLKSCLDFCNVMYRTTYFTVQQARSFAEAKNFGTAEASMEDVAFGFVPQCTDEFNRHRVDDSILKEWNLFLQKLSAISVNILQALQGKV